MRARARIILFLLAGSATLSLLIWGVMGLAPFGHYPGPYGDILNAAAVKERHVLNVVTSVIFDYRGFDTMGEEFILFASVTGVTLLLRHESKEQEDDSGPGAGEKPPEQSAILSDASDLVRLSAALFTGLILLFGIYIVVTGHLSLGGGFQGGVILSSAWLALFLAYGSPVFHRFSNKYAVEWLESSGAGLYVIVGLIGLVLGKNFLANFLPLGQTGQLLSSGTILLINCGVGVEVTAGFILLMSEFMKPLESEKPAR